MNRLSLTVAITMTTSTISASLTQLSIRIIAWVRAEKQKMFTLTHSEIHNTCGSSLMTKSKLGKLTKTCHLWLLTVNSAVKAFPLSATKASLTLRPTICTIWEKKVSLPSTFHQVTMLWPTTWTITIGTFLIMRNQSNTDIQGLMMGLLLWQAWVPLVTILKNHLGCLSPCLFAIVKTVRTV